MVRPSVEYFFVNVAGKVGQLTRIELGQLLEECGVLVHGFIITPKPAYSRNFYRCKPLLTPPKKCGIILAPIGFAYDLGDYDSKNKSQKP